MNVKDRIKQKYDSWVKIIDYECSLAKKENRGLELDGLFRSFLKNVIIDARQDERHLIEAQQRISALEQFANQNFPYMMPVPMFGYVDAEHMERELSEYAPDLLKEITIHNHNGGGSVGRISDEIFTEGRQTHGRDEGKDEGSGEDESNTPAMEEGENESANQEKVKYGDWRDDPMKVAQNYLMSPCAFFKHLSDIYKCDNCGCERGESLVDKYPTKTIPLCPMCKKGHMRYVDKTK